MLYTLISGFHVFQIRRNSYLRDLKKKKEATKSVKTRVETLQSRLYPPLLNHLPHFKQICPYSVRQISNKIPNHYTGKTIDMPRGVLSFRRDSGKPPFLLFDKSQMRYQLSTFSSGGNATRHKSVWSRDFSYPAALIRRRGLRNRVIEFHPWNRGFRLVQGEKEKPWMMFETTRSAWYFEEFILRSFNENSFNEEFWFCEKQYYLKLGCC